MGPIHRVIWFLIFNSICLFQRKLICSRKINVFKHHKHSTIHEPALPDWLSKGLETWDCLTCDAESSLFCAWEFRPVVHSRLWGKIKKPSENKCRNKINGVRFHSFREKYWRNSNKHLINPRWGCVLRKGTGTRASDQQNWARTSQKRFSEAGRASEVKQPYPVPACHSQSAQVPNTASQTSCWPAVMCEHGDGLGEGGSSRWPEPAPGKNGKSCLSWRLPQRHILPLCSFFSAEYPLCFSTGQVPTYPQARELCNSWELHDEMCCLP